MALEELLIAGHIFQGDDRFSRDKIDDPIDEQEGKPVGKILGDFFD
jgi:hypothetical protein